MDWSTWKSPKLSGLSNVNSTTESSLQLWHLMRLRTFTEKLARNKLVGDMDVESMYSFTEKDDVAREIEAAKEQIK